MGEADLRAPAQMGGVDPLVEHPEEVAHPLVASSFLIRSRLEDSGRQSGL